MLKKGDLLKRSEFLTGCLYDFYYLPDILVYVQLRPYLFLHQMIFLLTYSMRWIHSKHSSRINQRVLKSKQYDIYRYVAKVYKYVKNVYMRNKNENFKIYLP